MDTSFFRWKRIAALAAGLFLVNWSVWTVDIPPTVNVTSGKDEGFITHRFVDDDGSAHTFIVFLPYKNIREKLSPAILYLNGLGERGTDGLAPIVENMGQPVWEIKRRFPFVVIAPQSPPADGSWDPEKPHFQMVLRMLTYAIREFDIDPDRIALIGVSSGARDMVPVVASCPDLFAAAVGVSPALSSSTPVAGIAMAVSKTRMPIWIAFNRFDRGKWSELNRELKQEFLALGDSPFYLEHDAKGHDAWNRALRSPALYDWLLKQYKTKRLSRRFKLLDLEKFDSEHETRDDLSWMIRGSGMDCIIQSAEKNGSDSVLLFPSSCQEFELHAEFRALGESVFGFVIRSTDSGDESLFDWRIVLCDSLLGSGGLMSADGSNWIAALNPLSQRAIERNDWNDVRVQCDGPRLTVLINGWVALDVTDDRLLKRKRIGLWQKKGGADHSTEWRWIRTWDSAGPDTNEPGESR